MPYFQNLQNILDMNFNEMRGLQCAGGRRATDAAIHLFVDNLVAFYSQFIQPPIKEQLQRYVTYMENITHKINTSEYAYYLDKYSVEYGPEKAKEMAALCLLKSFRDIPKRMQYWAASEDFGGKIRNAENHITAIKNFDKWAVFVCASPRDSLFKIKNESSENKENVSTLTNA